MTLYDFIEQFYHVDLKDSKFTINIDRGKKDSSPETLTIKAWNNELKDWEYTCLTAWIGKRDKKIFKIGSYIVQLYKKYRVDEYVLGSLAKVIDCKENPNFGKDEKLVDRSKFSVETGYGPSNNRFIYKLEYIDLGIFKGMPLSLKFKMNQAYQLDCKRFKNDILVEPVSSYTAFRFPGYDKIDHTFNEMKSLIDKPEWRAALENQKGVYMLTDMSNGKHYIGSAYGEMRIYKRWKDYLTTGHGGNQGLVELGSEYMFKNFKMCILERCPDTMSDEEIIERESLYKDKYMTRQFGYNNN